MLTSITYYNSKNVFKNVHARLKTVNFTLVDEISNNLNLFTKTSLA